MSVSSGYGTSSSASFSTSGNDKTTQFAVGARSRIPIAKMISIYGDGMYSWVDSKTGIDQTVTIRSISQPTVTHDSSSGHSKGFTIDVGFEFTPVTNITVRTLVGIDRSKEGGEPESESTSYTVGLLYNF